MQNVFNVLARPNFVTKLGIIIPSTLILYMVGIFCFFLNGNQRCPKRGWFPFFVNSESITVYLINV